MYSQFFFILFRSPQRFVVGGGGRGLSLLWRRRRQLEEKELYSFFRYFLFDIVEEKGEKGKREKQGKEYVKPAVTIWLVVVFRNTQMTERKHTCIIHSSWWELCYSSSRKIKILSFWASNLREKSSTRLLSFSSTRFESSSRRSRQIKTKAVATPEAIG